MAAAGPFTSPLPPEPGTGPLVSVKEGSASVPRATSRATVSRSAASAGAPPETASNSLPPKKRLQHTGRPRTSVLVLVSRAGSSTLTGVEGSKLMLHVPVESSEKRSSPAQT